jgi:hypothetical protein
MGHFISFPTYKKMISKTALILIAGSMLLAVPLITGKDPYLREFEGDRCKAVILHEEGGYTDVFLGMIVNRKDQSLRGRYYLDISRQGVSGSSTSGQSGWFLINSRETSLISKVSVNIAEGDRYKAVLKIFVDEKLMCADSIFIEYH